MINMKIYRVAYGIRLSRDAMINLIEKEDWGKLSEYIYGQIRITPEFQDQSFDQNRNAVTPEVKQQYSQGVSSANKGNPAWAQWVVTTGLDQKLTVIDESGKQLQDAQFNFYLTPPDNAIVPFVQNITSLINVLKPIAEQYQTSVSFKVPSTASGYLGVNDRLKVYYRNKDAGQPLYQSTLSWLQSINAQASNRAYTFGYDADGKSYGQIVSGRITDYVKQYKAQGYTSVQLAQWIETYAPQLLSNVNIKS